MTFDEIFQRYAQQGFTKPIMPQGIETIMPVEQIAKPIVPQQLSSDSGGINNITTLGSYDPNVGKNFYDYEADAYGVGPTLQGGIAQLIDLYRQLPTPLNLALQGINYLTDKFGQPVTTSEQVITSPSGGDTGGGTISFSDESGYGGTGTSSPSAVGSTGMLGGGV